MLGKRLVLTLVIRSGWISADWARLCCFQGTNTGEPVHRGPARSRWTGRRLWRPPGRLPTSILWRTRISTATSCGLRGIVPGAKSPRVHVKRRLTSVCPTTTSSPSQSWGPPAASSSFGGFKSGPQFLQPTSAMSSPGFGDSSRYGMQGPAGAGWAGLPRGYEQQHSHQHQNTQDGDYDYEDYDISQDLLCNETLDFPMHQADSVLHAHAGIDFRRTGNGWTRMPSPPRSAAQTPSDGESDMEPYLRAKEAKARGPLTSLLTPNSKTGTGRNTPDTPFLERARIRPTKCRDPRLLSQLKTDEEVCSALCSLLVGGKQLTPCIHFSFPAPPNGDAFCQLDFAAKG